jgi:hypothetical protein
VQLKRAREKDTKRKKNAAKPGESKVYVYLKEGGGGAPRVGASAGVSGSSLEAACAAVAWLRALLLYARAGAAGAESASAAAAGGGARRRPTGRHFSGRQAFGRASSAGARSRRRVSALRRRWRATVSVVRRRVRALLRRRRIRRPPNKKI